MRLGITGHRELKDPRAWPWVETVLREHLKAIAPPIIGVTSLAIGADQLFARLVLEVGGSLHAVVPFPDIERSFSPGDLAAYRQLVRDAEVEVLRTPGTDDDAFLAAGERVVDLSDVVLAVWDGNPAKGRGGTGDVVSYATRRGVPVVHIDPAARSVRIPDVPRPGT